MRPEELTEGEAVIAGDDVKAIFDAGLLKTVQLTMKGLVSLADCCRNRASWILGATV